MNKNIVIAAQKRIIDSDKFLPHLEAIGIANIGENYYLTASFSRSATRKEKNRIIELADNVRIEIETLDRLQFW